MPLKVLVACEFSGRVRSEFRKRGHSAWSCDLLSAEDKSPYHIQDDVFNILDYGWDLMIAHPPCTHLAVSGARHFAVKQADGRQDMALGVVRDLLNADIPKIALENPVSIISSRIRKPDQYIEPWMFGHEESKKTGLWLKNIPKLKSTYEVYPEMGSVVHYLSPGPDRWKDRSRTYEGIAEAMAQQWG